jgi:hypothetical protein
LWESDGNDSDLVLVEAFARAVLYMQSKICHPDQSKQTVIWAHSPARPAFFTILANLDARRVIFKYRAGFDVPVQKIAKVKFEEEWQGDAQIDNQSSPGSFRQLLHMISQARRHGAVSFFGVGPAQGWRFTPVLFRASHKRLPVPFNRESRQAHEDIQLMQKRAAEREAWARALAHERR